MTQVNIHEAKTQFSRLLAKVAEGEEIVIARAGKPVARLVPWTPDKPRVFGLFAGQVKISDDFDELPAEIEAAFEGEQG